MVVSVPLDKGSTMPVFSYICFEFKYFKLDAVDIPLLSKLTCDRQRLIQ